MPDFSKIVERLKNNKFAIPAIGVGVVAGGYVLLKNGGLGGGGNGSPILDPALVPDPGAGAVGGGGGGGNEGIGEVVAAQESLAKQVQDQIAKIVSDIQEAFLYQTGQTQGAIDAIAGQTQGAIDAIAAQQAGLAEQFSSQYQGAYDQLPNYAPDLSALYAAISQIPQQVQQTAPQLPLGISNITSKLNQLAVRPISTQSLRIGGQAKSLTTTSGYTGRSALGLGGLYSSGSKRSYLGTNYSKIGGVAKSLGSLSGYSGKSALGIGASRPIPKAPKPISGGSGAILRK